MSITEQIKAELRLPAFVVNTYLEDLTDDQLMIRPHEKANHIAWQLGHLITAKRKKAQGRKKPRRGAQPGHERQLREPLPPERVDETIEYEIDDGEVQRLGLTPTGDFDVIQHIELPETPVHVTEH